MARNTQDFGAGASGEGDGHARGLAGRLASDERGSIGIMMGMTALVVMLVVAVAVDYGRADLEYQRVQRAADAAALAASHRLGLADQDRTGEEIALKFFKANTGGRTYETIESVELDAAKGEVRVKANGTVFSSLLNSVGIKQMGIGGASKVIKGNGTVEIALVLDNSGSMAGQPIADLITAAKDLTNVVFTGAETSERVRMSVVPFSGAVNVGGGYQDAAWLDQTGASPINGANFATNTPRLAVFDKLGVAWRGCVEARPAPYDVTDDAADAKKPETLFVPMFAPDEPDGENDSGNSYQNSYLTDDGGSCTPQPTTCTSWSRRGNCQKWVKTPLPSAEAQARMCKYDTPLTSGAAGPNYMCDSEALLPLTSSKSEIEAKLSTLVAKGSTNIAEGLMWGWRALSPEEPLPEGRSYGTPDNEKVLVLMTDGANTYSAMSNHNKSWYAAHGYGASGRLGTTYSSTGYVAQMNAKTLAACTNAKAKGIKVYTVAFRLDTDPATQALLQSCASEASMAFRPSDGTALISAFQKIGTEISKLRVAG